MPMKAFAMPTVTKQVPIEEIPKLWRKGLGESRIVRVTLETVPEASKRAGIQDILSRITPSKIGGKSSTETLRDMRADRLNRLNS